MAAVDQAKAMERDASAGILPWVLLVAAAVFWSGNWVASRGIRETVPPIALTFWRWLPVVVLLAPIVLPAMRGRWGEVRRHWRILLLLSFLGVPLFTALVYFGTQETTAVNAVLLNSALPLATILWSWLLERERATSRQVLGLAVSFAGILLVMTRGEVGQLLALEFHRGDACILGAMLVWGLYSVLLKRRPREPDGLNLVFVLGLIGTIIVAPFYALESLLDRPAVLTPGSAATVLYIALFASIGAYLCWNRGVAAVGANRAGFTIHLLPLFGTVLAIVLLGEEARPYHLVGFIVILVGVWVATAPQRASTASSAPR